VAGERILIVEDESRIVEVLERYLRAEGYAVERAGNGRDALALWRASAPDLILLDLMIPDPDGLSVASTIRAEDSVPIIMLTAMVDEGDRLRGLALGADDYISKPFSPREVVARVRAVLRRASGQTRAPQHHRIGGLNIDLVAFEAHCGSKRLELSPTQLRLLSALAAGSPQVLSRQELAAVQTSTFADERTIDAHIKNLRARLGPCRGQLRTVRGIGYQLTP
jgi:two-component system response regulator BaeR/two-component system response regulator AdeR